LRPALLGRLRGVDLISKRTKRCSEETASVIVLGDSFEGEGESMVEFVKQVGYRPGVKE